MASNEGMQGRSFFYQMLEPMSRYGRSVACEGEAVRMHFMYKNVTPPSVDFVAAAGQGAGGSGCIDINI